jgi:hypothetical protein
MGAASTPVLYHPGNSLLLSIAFALLRLLVLLLAMRTLQGTQAGPFRGPQSVGVLKHRPALMRLSKLKRRDNVRPQFCRLSARLCVTQIAPPANLINGPAGVSAEGAAGLTNLLTGATVTGQLGL